MQKSTSGQSTRSARRTRKKKEEGARVKVKIESGSSAAWL